MKYKKALDKLGNYIPHDYKTKKINKSILLQTIHINLMLKRLVRL